VTRLAPILLSAALAGCTVPGILPDPAPATPPAPAVVPAQVAPFLPPGAPPNVVFQDGQGCYLYSIEVTDPPSGFPVRDAAGNQVCDGRPVAIAAPVAPAATGSVTPSTAPAPALAPPPAPATSAPGSSASNLIDGVPVGQIPPPAPLAVPLPDPVR
jgi:hypothetical protein